MLREQRDRQNTKYSGGSAEVGERARMPSR